MNPLPLDQYLQMVDYRAGAAGFVRHGAQPEKLQPQRLFHRRNVSITKFALLDTFVLLQYLPPADLTPEVVRAIGERTFEFGLKHKSFLPRGFFGGLVVYPVILSNVVPQGVHAFMQQHAPKHWSSFEFGAVVDLSVRQLICFSGTPLWGAFYYDGFRSELHSICAPG